MLVTQCKKLLYEKAWCHFFSLFFSCNFLSVFRSFIYSRFFSISCFPPPLSSPPPPLSSDFASISPVASCSEVTLHWLRPALNSSADQRLHENVNLETLSIFYQLFQLRIILCFVLLSPLPPRSLISSKSLYLVALSTCFLLSSLFDHHSHRHDQQESDSQVVVHGRHEESWDFSGV